MDVPYSSADKNRQSPERRFLVDVLSAAVVADAGRRRAPSLDPGQAAKAMRGSPKPKVGREETLLLFTNGRSLGSTARKPGLSGGIAGGTRTGAGASRGKPRKRGWTAKGLPGLMDGILGSELAAGTLDLGAGRKPQRSNTTDFFTKKSTFDELRDELKEPRKQGVLGLGSTVRELTRPLNPPEGWEGTTTCLDKIKGSTSTCTTENTAQSWFSVFELDVNAAAKALKFSDTTKGDEELILHSWAVLQANLDLVRWSICWVTGRTEGWAGKEEVWNCLFKHLKGEKRTRIKMKSGHKKSFSAGPVNGIRIWRGSNAWLDYLLGWLAGKSGACELDLQDAACVALDLACTLLHESIHVCVRSTGDESGDCRKSYLVENIFRWALMKRYSSVAGSECCSPFIGEEGEELFGHDGAKFANDCIQEQRGPCLTELTGGLV